jgi:hypothetical protein
MSRLAYLAAQCLPAVPKRVLFFVETGMIVVDPFDGDIALYDGQRVE